MKKKVDGRVHQLLQNAAQNHHRALVVVVGDRGKDQVVNFHYLLSKVTEKKPSVLWCFDKELGFSSHRKKRLRQLRKKASSGAWDPNIDDPFELFVSTVRIRYCYYKETTRILGQTFGMCVLQDFEAITPNILCRAIETVEGGGLILLLLRSMESLEQLYQLTMNYHRNIAPRPGLSVEPRFVKRFILSLTRCDGCMILDDELSLLPLLSKAEKSDSAEASSREDSLSPKVPVRISSTAVAREQFSLGAIREDPELLAVQAQAQSHSIAGPLVQLAVTADQARALNTFIEIVQNKALNSTMSLTSGRGRGKSATLGLVVAAAIALGYTNVFLTAPSPENVRTVFEFVERGLLALGFQEHADFELVVGELSSQSGYFANRNYEAAEMGLSTKQEAQVEISPTRSNGDHAGKRAEGSTEGINETSSALALSAGSQKHVVRLNIFKTHRQTVQFIAPDDLAFARQAEILIIDEAAAIPLPIVRALIGPYFVFLSSTVHGYEGTGRSLSLKLIGHLKKSKLTKVHEITLDTPIRYAAGDPIEEWLEKLLCLDATIPTPLQPNAQIPVPQQCALYHVDRTTLFSCHAQSELFLKKLLSLFVSSHYKNSPNDLLLLSDSPSQRIFVLLGPMKEEDGSLEDVPDVLAAIQVSLEGNINKQIVTEALKAGQCPSGDLLPWTLSQTFVDEDFAVLTGLRIVRIAVHPAVQGMGFGTAALRLLLEHVEGSTNGNSEGNGDNNDDEDSSSQPLLAPCEPAQFYAKQPVDYIGTSFGMTKELVRFHSRLGFKAVYLRQSKNEITGENSIIMLRPLLPGTADKPAFQLDAFVNDFQGRLTRSLALPCFRDLPSLACMLILDPASTAASEEGILGYRLSPITPETIHGWLTPSDLMRLKRYTQQLMDRSAVADMISSLAEAIFFKRLQSVNLSNLQATVLLALGLQRKSAVQLAEELAISPHQVNALLFKAVQRIHTKVTALLEESANSSS